MSVDGQNVEQIRVDLIMSDEARVRFLNPARVMQLADSIEETGLQNPITIRPEKDGAGYQLVSGAHRLAAFSELGREHIPVFVREMTDEDARLFEVRENLHREELSARDWSLHLATEKLIYEARNPEAKQGGDRRSDQKVNVDLLKKPRRFTAEMADALGCGEKNVKRAVQIAKGITSELHAEIHGTPLADNQAQLLALVKYPEARRPLLARIMREEGYGKVSDADQHAEGRRPKEKPNQSDKEIWMRKIHSLWAHGRKHWQDDFLTLIDAVREEKGGA